MSGSSASIVVPSPGTEEMRSIPPNKSRALAHARQAHRQCRLHYLFSIKAGALVDNKECQCLLAHSYLDHGFGSLRMACDIGQRFLDDAIGALSQPREAGDD